MTMPLAWVEKIFQKLTVVYGRDFFGKYEGVPMADVKADWAHELSGFEAAPHAIKYALQNLPHVKPPTVFEFRAIAQRAPSAVVPALDAPRANPDVVRKALDEARALLTRMKA